jgi:hypothetical protein
MSDLGFDVGNEHREEYDNDRHDNDRHGLLGRARQPQHRQVHAESGLPRLHRSADENQQHQLSGEREYRLSSDRERRKLSVEFDDREQRQLSVEFDDREQRQLSIEFVDREQRQLSVEFVDREQRQLSVGYECFDLGSDDIEHQLHVEHIHVESDEPDCAIRILGLSEHGGPEHHG